MKETRTQVFNKTSYLKTINPMVLKMIHNKKYPLSEEKYKKMQKKKEQHQIVRNHHVKTLPADSTNKIEEKKGSKSKLKKKEVILEERTIGDHLHYENLRHELSPYRASEEMEEVHNKLNVYIWERKKQVLGKYSSTQRFSTQNTLKTFKENQTQTHTPVQFQLQQPTMKTNGFTRHSIDELPQILKNLRKQIHNEPINDIVEEEMAYRKSDFLDTKMKFKLKEYTLRDKENGKWMKGMKRQPQRGKEGKMDENARMRREMMKEAKEMQQCQSSDRFCKMRIELNHKKIVNLG